MEIIIGKTDRIPLSAFRWSIEITKVVISDGVNSIEDEAFCECEGLTSITIPESVTSIGNYAFYFCSSLTDIKIPDGVTSIGNSTFTDCRSLTSINIPEGVTSIGNHAFHGCEGLTSINIPNGVTSIGAAAFLRCKGLTNINIPESVTSIGYWAFSNCTNLDIVINNSKENVEVDDEAFKKCKSVTWLENQKSEKFIKMPVEKRHAELFDIVELPRWRAKEGEAYCYVADVGIVTIEKDRGRECDNCRYEVGNYFKTLEDTQPFATKIREIFKRKT